MIGPQNNRRNLLPSIRSPHHSKLSMPKKAGNRPFQTSSNEIITDIPRPMLGIGCDYYYLHAQINPYETLPNQNEESQLR